MPRLQTLDALNRRSRFAGRQPTGKRIILGARDFAVFSALERHGPLPSTYLYAFSKHEARNYKGFQQRLTDLYNEDCTPHHDFYLDRPEQQNASINARYQPITHELTPVGAQALRDHGLPQQMWERPNGPYLHRFMTSCLTASLELAARERGIKFLSQCDIFNHPKCPASIRSAEHPLGLRHREGTIIPDQLCGLDYGGRYRFFAIEADRKTETIVSTRASTKAVAKKLDAYVQVLRNQTYKDVWGIPTLNIMIVTTSDAHMKTMIHVLESMAEPNEVQRFLFKSTAAFGKYWTVPPVMTDLLYEPWQRVGDSLNLGQTQTRIRRKRGSCLVLRRHM
jgi:hypothetical protein